MQTLTVLIPVLAEEDLFGVPNLFWEKMTFLVSPNLFWQRRAYLMSSNMFCQRRTCLVSLTCSGRR